MNKWKHVLFVLFVVLSFTYSGIQGNLYCQEGSENQAAKKSIAEVLHKTITEKDVAAAIKQYHRLKKTAPDAYDFAERELNNLGYRLMREGKLKDAIEIFKLNIEAYPRAFNPYDSLGEAYMNDGNKELAVKNYKKSVELNPDNVNGKKFAFILEHYSKKEYMVPMRDGVKLFTQVYSPVDTSVKYPIMLKRTPYSIRPYGKNLYTNRLGPSMLFVKERYIFVYQDVRGKYKSEGSFVVMKPHKTLKRAKTDTDESSDTYDTIDWLLKNVPNHNGRVGQWGISYPGWQTVMGMIDAHPALKASSPQASPADMWIGDDFHHNGAFRLMYTFGWLWYSAQARTGPSVGRVAPVNFGTPDGYKFFLELGPISNVDKKYFHKNVPTWNEYMEHGDYDEYWKKQDILRNLNNIKHPILNVAGWFDAEDFYGPMSIYYTIEKKNPLNKSTLVVGPWLHGGWAHMDGDALGDIRFDVKTGVYYRKNVELPFFNYYLKDKGEFKLPEALVFETGSNRWKSYDNWPPKDAVEKKIYLRAGGKLSFTPPAEESKQAADSYTSDPDNPVPWSSRIQLRQGHLWMVEDQRFASRRPDVLVYQSDVLTEDVTIAGPIIANLFVSTTGTDADWIVKLIDVYPGDAPNNRPNPCNVKMGDYQMLLAGEVFRGKYRNSFEKPEPMVPNKVTKIEYDLRDKYHCFRKGHRIMVQIQSTWFPVIDRNPQKFVDIYHAAEEDFQKAVHTVYRSKVFPSHLKVRLTEKKSQ
jgi:putative CocE/NonD family hydrolase